MSLFVRDVMTTNPIVLSETSTVVEAALVMREADVGAVLVMRRDAIRGILTDRDVVVRFVADGHDAALMFIGEICSADVTEVSPDDRVERAVELMRDHVIRRLPVVDNGRLVGVVSLGDLACSRDPASALAEISSARCQHLTRVARATDRRRSRRRAAGGEPGLDSADGSPDGIDGRRTDGRGVCRVLELGLGEAGERGHHDDAHERSGEARDVRGRLDRDDVRRHAPLDRRERQRAGPAEPHAADHDLLSGPGRSGSRGRGRGRRPRRPRWTGRIP